MMSNHHPEPKFIADVRPKYPTRSGVLMEFFDPGFMSSCAPIWLSFRIFVRPTLGHRSSLGTVPVRSGAGVVRQRSSKRRETRMRANLWVAVTEDSKMLTLIQRNDIVSV